MSKPSTSRPATLAFPGCRPLLCLLSAGLLAAGCSTGQSDYTYTTEGLVLPPQAHESARFAQDMLDAVNAVRSRGYACASGYYPAAPPVTWNSRLGMAAQAHADDLAARGRLSHFGSNGSTPFERMQAAGYRFANAGENVGQGHPDVATVMKRWLKSPSGHCDAIMDAAYEDMGAGLAVGSVDGRETRFWVLNAGRSR